MMMSIDYHRHFVTRWAALSCDEGLVCRLLIKRDKADSFKQRESL